MSSMGDYGEDSGAEYEGETEYEETDELPDIDEIDDIQELLHPNGREAPSKRMDLEKILGP